MKANKVHKGNKSNKGNQGNNKAILQSHKTIKMELNYPVKHRKAITHQSQAKMVRTHKNKTNSKEPNNKVQLQVNLMYTIAVRKSLYGLTINAKPAKKMKSTLKIKTCVRRKYSKLIQTLKILFCLNGST